MTNPLTAMHARLLLALERSRDDRGDIPGWVMVVLMTAAIVAAVWALAEPALTRLFNDAIENVGG